MGASDRMPGSTERPGAQTGRVRIAPNREMELSVNCSVRSTGAPAESAAELLPTEATLVQVSRFGVALGSQLAELGMPPDVLHVSARVGPERVDLDVFGRGARLMAVVVERTGGQLAAGIWRPREAVVHATVGIEHAPPSHLPVVAAVEAPKPVEEPLVASRGTRRGWVWAGVGAVVAALVLVAYVVDSRAPAGGVIAVAGSTAVATPPPATATPLPAATPAPTAAPTAAPTQAPIAAAATAPTVAPTLVPTSAPTSVPTLAPTAPPTVEPTAAPTLAPTAAPTLGPTAAPTLAATLVPTIAPAIAPTATAAPAPTSTPVPAPRSLLAARFVGATTPPIGLPNAADGPAWFASDGYHLRARTPGQFVAVAIPLDAPVSNAIVTLRYRKLSGPPGGGVGIILRDQTPARHTGTDQGGRFYVLEASDRGEVGVWRREQADWQDLVPWLASPSLRPANDGNTLEAHADGTTLRLLVNGQPAASAEDAALPAGGIGLFLGGDSNEAVIEELTIQSLE